MTQLLRQELKKRGRVWGQQNAAVLDALRRDKLTTQRWPLRPMLALGSGCYITRIPRAA